MCCLNCRNAVPLCCLFASQPLPFPDCYYLASQNQQVHTEPNLACTALHPPGPLLEQLATPTSSYAFHICHLFLSHSGPHKDWWGVWWYHVHKEIVCVCVRAQEFICVYIDCVVLREKISWTEGKHFLGCATQQKAAIRSCSGRQWWSGRRGIGTRLRAPAVYTGCPLPKAPPRPPCNQIRPSSWKSAVCGTQRGPPLCKESASVGSSAEPDMQESLVWLVPSRPSGAQ